MSDEVTTVELKRDTHEKIYYEKDPFQSYDDYISELMEEDSDSA